MFVFSPRTLNGQEIKWQNTIGGNGIDILQSLQTTTDGGYILGGRSDSNISGDKSQNSKGDDDYWVVKLDSIGTIQWDKTIGGDSTDYLLSISQTLDGGYILGGHSLSDISGDKTEVNKGGYDFWIVKLNAAGNIIWQKTIGGNNTDYLSIILQTADTGFIIGGYSLSNVSGDKTENSMGGWDYWVIKTDSIGNIQWQNTIGGIAGETLTTISMTVDGGYLIGGYSSSDSSPDKTENSQGSVDYWVLKLDSSGFIEWDNTIGGNLGDYLTSSVATVGGGFLLGGWSQSTISGDKTEINNGGIDFWIIKLDSTGNLLWQNTIGGSSHDYLRTVALSNDGRYLIGGDSNSGFSGDKSEDPYGSSDYWIIELDSLGEIEWQNSIGGNNSDQLKVALFTNNGKYIIGGYSNSDNSGDKLEGNIAGYDFWVIELTKDFNLINGKAFADINNNNVLDSNESTLTNHLITENNTGRYSFTNQNGIYSLSVLDSGNFQVNPFATINYYNSSPLNHNVSFSSILQIDSLNDFAFQPTGMFNDLCISITPLGPFRSGFSASYQITYENVGTTTLNPTVIFFADDDVSFVSATPIANVITPDSVVWNFSPLTPFQTGSILVTVNVATGVPIGTLINSSAVIEPIAGDANTSCNYSFWEVFTIGSYDPNDILVDEDTLLTTQFPNPPYLEYVIRFQNTGNDTAFTVKILNPIDTFKLDLSTLEFIASSPPVNFNWITWERNMEFRFENILLPDSNVNEPESHGFVRYRIKPNSTLTAGDSIPNYAAIYFDFNAPVITNTAVTHIVLPTSLNEISSSSDHLLLYPNPANSTLTIETGILSNLESRLVISDVTGRIMFSNFITATSTNYNIDISSLSKGIYFVQLRTGERISRGRFVKE